MHLVFLVCLEDLVDPEAHQFLEYLEHQLLLEFLVFLVFLEYLAVPVVLVVQQLLVFLLCLVFLEDLEDLEFLEAVFWQREPTTSPPKFDRFESQQTDSHRQSLISLVSMPCTFTC